ncbi:MULTISPECIES: amidohydrolase family protein [unclassified Cupriavidus]|uniref:amidohydrolase family protein n=1 Tax=unclassified Cupriavidus TaxID=2640874 RepID=UPI00313D8C70
MSTSPPALPTAVVDTHHHLWRLETGHYPWLQDRYDAAAFFLGDYASLRRDFDTADYLTQWRRVPGVTLAATVHVEAERDRAESLAETAWLHAVHREAGFPNAVIAHVDFLSPTLDDDLRAQLDYPLVRGVRCKPLTAASADAAAALAGQSGTLQDPQWRAGLRALADRGLIYDLRVPYWHLEEAAEAIAAVPELDVVVEHAGLPWDRSPEGLARWRRGLAALASLPRVSIKLSEFGLPQTPWQRESNVAVIREVLSLFGAHRCMFASNLPVSGLRASLPEIVATVGAALEGLPASDARAVWHDNALRIYRITQQAGASS